MPNGKLIERQDMTVKKPKIHTLVVDRKVSLCAPAVPMVVTHFYLTGDDDKLETDRSPVLAVAATLKDRYEKFDVSGSSPKALTAKEIRKAGWEYVGTETDYHCVYQNGEGELCEHDCQYNSDYGVIIVHPTDSPVTQAQIDMLTERLKKR